MSINQEHPMTDQDERPINQEERIERLSVRILAGAREIVSRGDGRMFTMDQLRHIFPSINAQRHFRSLGYVV